MELLSPQIWQEIQPIFHREYPKEAIVAIWGDKWRQLDNVADNPYFTFALSQEDNDYLLKHKPTLLLHSHPSGDPSPSDTDLAQQLASNMNWGIVAVKGNHKDVYEVSYPEMWGNDVPIPPLVGRSYLFGIRDCWSLLRDWHRLNGMNVKEIPRTTSGQYPTGDWRNDPFAYWPLKIGFKEVKARDRQPGDAVVMKLRAPVYNHCMIYLGQGEYIHQLRGQMSDYWRPANEERLIEMGSFRYYRYSNK